MGQLRWLLLPAFVGLHGGAMGLSPAQATTVSMGFQIAAPVVAAMAALRQCRATSFRPSDGWSMVAAAFVLWTLGICAPIAQARWTGGASQVAAHADILLFVLYATPLAWLTSTPFRHRDATPVQSIDGITALALGMLFFALTLSIASNGQEALSTRQLALLFDVENMFLLAGACFRYWAASSAAERRLYLALLVYAALYAAVAAFNNNVVTRMLDLQGGNFFEVLIPIPFIAFALAADNRLGRADVEHHRLALRARYARVASPLILYLAVVCTGLALTRTQFALGVVATLLALAGYAMRSMVRELRLIEQRTQLRKSRAEVQAQALIDALTGVANRRALDRALERECKAASRSGGTLGVILVDIDHFKLLNDSSGHAAGDECLRTVARTLRAQLRRPEDLLARYGGEEFLVLLPATDRDGTLKMAQTLRQSVQDLQWPNPGAPTGRLGISLGAACEVPSRPDDGQRMAQDADSALYRAKQQGRNRVCAAWLPDGAQT